jgi:hypothetical protein
MPLRHGSTTSALVVGVNYWAAWQLVAEGRSLTNSRHGNIYFRAEDGWDFRDYAASGDGSMYYRHDFAGMGFPDV